LYSVVRLTRFLLATLAFSGVVCAGAGASSSTAPRASAGSIGLRLVDVPAAAAADPRARIYIVDHLAPGTTIHRRVEVTNTAGSTTHVGLYAAAAAVDGGSFLGAAGHTPNDLSTWTSIRPGAADVPARGRVSAAVTIAVPSDAAPGERYGVVWAEARSAPNASGVTQVSRVGIRIYLSVGPGGPPAADFTIESLTAARSPDGRPLVRATVRNTGGRALDMNGTLQLLAGPGGLSAGPFPVTLGVTLAIGDTEPVTIVLDEQIPAGPWDARITLRSGLLVRDARATILFPATGAAAPVSAEPSRPAWVHPAIAGCILLMVALGLVLFSVKGRRPPTKRRHIARPVM